MLAPAIVALAGPRGALAMVGAALPLIVARPLGGAQADWRRAPLAHVGQRRQQRLDLPAQALEVRRQRQLLAQRSSGSSVVKPGPIVASS